MLSAPLAEFLRKSEIRDPKPPPQPRLQEGPFLGRHSGNPGGGCGADVCLGRTADILCAVKNSSHPSVHPPAGTACQGIATGAPGGEEAARGVGMPRMHLQQPGWRGFFNANVLHLRAGFSAPIYSEAPGESLLHVEKSKTLINKHLEHRHFKLSYSLWKCHLVTTTNMSCAFHARLGNTWQRLHKRRHCCSCCGVPLCAPTGRGVPSHQTVRK